MLQLKRKIGEMLTIDREFEVTLVDYSDESCDLLLQTASTKETITLRQKVPHTIVTPGGDVQVTLHKISRGEAWLGFKAPLSISIQREER